MTRLEKLEQQVGDALARQWGALQSATVNDIPVLAQYIAGQLDNGTEQALAIEMALEWIANLMARFGEDAVLDALPNGCGGRNQLREALE